jgi:hypothetical protein
VLLDKVGQMVDQQQASTVWAPGVRKWAVGERIVDVPGVPDLAYQIPALRPDAQRAGPRTVDEAAGHQLADDQLEF